MACDGVATSHKKGEMKHTLASPQRTSNWNLQYSDFDTDLKAFSLLLPWKKWAKLHQPNQQKNKIVNKKLVQVKRAECVSKEILGILPLLFALLLLRQNETYATFHVTLGITMKLSERKKIVLFVIFTFIPLHIHSTVGLNGVTFFGILNAYSKYP